MEIKAKPPGYWWGVLEEAMNKIAAQAKLEEMEARKKRHLMMMPDVRPDGE